VQVFDIKSSVPQAGRPVNAAGLGRRNRLAAGVRMESGRNAGWIAFILEKD